VQGKENIHEFIDGDALSNTLMADLEILAIDTPEITGSEEYVS
jgi:hypothetical protein